MIFSLNTKEWDINKEGVTMFEKEAEEWVKENMDCCETDNFVNQSIPYFSAEERCIAKSAFKDGAEFGYNKANEWHYNGVPHDNKPYLCKVIHPKSREMTDLEILFYDEKDMSWFRWLTLWSGKEGNETARINRKVIAWKEIVPPKESE